MNAPIPGWGDHHVATFFTFAAKMLLGYDMSGYYWTMLVLACGTTVVVAIVLLAPKMETMRRLAQFLVNWHW